VAKRDTTIEVTLELVSKRSGSRDGRRNRRGAVAAVAM
jgi:hypothetical protein